MASPLSSVRLTPIKNCVLPSNEVGKIRKGIIMVESPGMRKYLLIPKVLQPCLNQKLRDTKKKHDIFRFLWDHAKRSREEAADMFSKSMVNFDGDLHVQKGLCQCLDDTMCDGDERASSLKTDYHRISKIITRTMAANGKSLFTLILFTLILSSI